ncbi:hypothetical protein OAB57_01310, partial [Bacteriovoracaceae bacterium]|nr:hypothetical protein [Bacteriovoracaceae bacterium]
MFGHKSLILTILFLTTTNCWALLYQQKISGKITKTTLDNNQLIINKGLSDGVVVGDFARFYYQDSFLFKAAAILSNTFESEWIIYYVTAKVPLEVNSSISLEGIYGNKRPLIVNLDSLQEQSLTNTLYENNRKKFLSKKRDQI